MVKRGGQEIELTSKEFALLEFMLLHPNQVLSRTQIGEQVWGYDFYNQSNIVDVYVGYLRRKIDDGRALQLIRTVRGAGYKLSADGVSHVDAAQPAGAGQCARLPADICRAGRRAGRAAGGPSL